MASAVTPAPLPQTMKQLLQPDIQFTHLILTTAPVPQPTEADDVLVRVAASCPCAGELLWAKNFPDAVPKDKEMVPGQDLAGTVVLAPDSSPFRPGDRVFSRVPATRAGTAREYAIAKVSELAAVPEGLGWAEAAAVPLSALTAWQALFVHGGLVAPAAEGKEKKNAGKRVLITGAAGGVGSWAVQLASLAGVGAVVAVCGGAGKAAAVRKLGATEVVDYTRTSVGEWAAADPAAREVDLVFDLVGGETLAGCWRAIREGAVLVSANTPPDMVRPAGLEKEVEKSVFFIVEPSGSNLAEIAELIGAGKVRPVVDSVWPFEQFEKAFEKLEDGHAQGKIVINVGGEEV